MNKKHHQKNIKQKQEITNEFSSLKYFNLQYPAAFIINDH